MTGAAQRYDEIRVELMLLRAMSGPLSQDVEADFAADLQRCWEAMTDEEQEQLKKSLADEVVPVADESLDQEDKVVPEGGRSLPRKAAAA